MNEGKTELLRLQKLQIDTLKNDNKVLKKENSFKDTYLNEVKLERDSMRVTAINYKNASEKKSKTIKNILLIAVPVVVIETVMIYFKW